LKKEMGDRQKMIVASQNLKLIEEIIIFSTNHVGL